MKLSDLKKVLDGVLRPEDFETLLHQEVAEHLEHLEKKGTSAPVYIDEDINITIKSRDMNVLQDFRDNSRLSQHVATYVADALCLSEAAIFESDEIEEMAFVLSEA